MSSMDVPVLLDAVNITSELDRRRARAPDFEAENQALVGLMKMMQHANANVLQQLSETALSLCQAHSAGISVAETEDGRDVFRCHGAAGRGSSILEQTTPRAASACGTVLDRNAPLLMAHPERHFGYPKGGVLAAAEVMLVPFQVEGVAVGTIWIVAHDETRRFDREDLRLLGTLSEFASLAYQVGQQASQVREALAKERAGAELLQAISAGLIHEHEIAALYEQFLDAAMAIMQADFASMQMVRSAGDLQLLASRGFHPESARFWRHLTLHSTTACGRAMHTGERFIIVDTEQSEMLAGTADLEEFRRSGIRAVQSTPLRSRAGQLIGVLSTHWRQPHEPAASELRLFDVLARLAADLLERARTEQALREADHRKDEFLAVLSHELRNPLAPLTTGLELLQLAGDKAELSDGIHTMMRRQLSHLVRLVDDLLDLSRVTRDKIELQCTRLELRVVIETAVELSKPLIDQRAHELLIEHARSSLPIYGDLHRLIQVVANVLGNAAKYMERGGTIQVRSGSVDGQAVIRIGDSGLGIPAERLESVFEMFSQVPEHRLRGGGTAGLGIGLTLSRRLLQLHSGSIEAHSEGLGRGSEFVIRLPLAADGERSDVDQRADIGAASKRRRVLIVDDNLDAATTLRAGLEALGHTAQVAHDGSAALMLLDTFGPELLLLDIGMPRLDGYELARRIRALPGGETLVLAALTGWGQESDRHRARDAGFDHHLTKPVKLETIQALLSDAPSG